MSKPDITDESLVERNIKLRVIALEFVIGSGQISPQFWESRAQDLYNFIIDEGDEEEEVTPVRASNVHDIFSVVPDNEDGEEEDE